MSLTRIGACAALALMLGRAAAQAPEPPKFETFTQPVIVIRNVTLVDGTGAPARPGMDVRLEGGKIASLAPTGPEPDGQAAVIDGTGKTLLPGFVLMHEHMFYPTGKANYTEMVFSFPRLYLAGGVTTLRTAGTMNPYADLNLRDAIGAGTIPGPSIDVTAPYLNGPGLPILKVNALGNPDDAERMVTYWADEGVTSYKAYMQITRDELGRVIEIAHGRGQKVTAHLCSVTYREALDLGIDNLEHGFFAATDFVQDKKPDACPEGDDVVASLASLDPDGPEAQALIRDLVGRHVALTSTLTVFETLTPGRPRAPEAALNLLIPEIRAIYESRWTEVQQKSDPQRARLFETMMKMERAFVAAGGMLLAGTDPTGYGGVIPGFSSKRQIQLLIEAGFSFEESVRIATLNGAVFLGRESEIGTIEAGKRADLVLIGGGPESASLDRVETVFRGGIGYGAQAIIDSLKATVGLY